MYSQCSKAQCAARGFYNPIFAFCSARWYRSAQPSWKMKPKRLQYVERSQRATLKKWRFSRCSARCCCSCDKKQELSEAVKSRYFRRHFSWFSASRRSMHLTRICTQELFVEISQLHRSSLIWILPLESALHFNTFPLSPLLRKHSWLPFPTMVGRYKTLCAGTSRSPFPDPLRRAYRDATSAPWVCSKFGVANGKLKQKWDPKPQDTSCISEFQMKQNDTSGDKGFWEWATFSRR